MPDWHVFTNNLDTRPIAELAGDRLTGLPDQSATVAARLGRRSAVRRTLRTTHADRGGRRWPIADRRIGAATAVKPGFQFAIGDRDAFRLTQSRQLELQPASIGDRKVTVWGVKRGRGAFSKWRCVASS
jgi:hypothetical protein